MTSFNPAATPDPATAAAAPVTPPATPAVAAAAAPALVYNGKAFTPEELANKLANQDQFIETLKSERAADRELLTQATAALKAQLTARELLATPPAVPATAAATPPVQVDVGAEVDRVLSARAAASTEAQNWTLAQTAMTAAFGDQADAKVREVAATVGYSFDEVVVLAKTKPAAFKRLFPELSAPPTTTVVPTPTTGRVNTQALKTEALPKGKAFWGNSHRDSTAAYIERLNAIKS